MEQKYTIENKLWSQIIQDDEKAFNTIFNKYFSCLCNFCFHIVNEAETAEEIVSDVFIKLWLNRHSIEIKSDLKPYLYKATKNTALNHLRLSSSKVKIDEVNEKNLISNINTDSGLMRDEIFNELQKIINSLPPQQCLILKMHKLEGLSKTEIAEALSISLKTVQNNIYLALKYLTERWDFLQSEFCIIVILLLTIAV